MFVVTHKSLKRGWILVLANGVYAVAYGVLAEVFTGFIVESNVRAAGVELSEFASLQAGLVDQYLFLTRSVGYLWIAFGVFVVYLAFTGYRLGSRVAWLAYLVCGGIAWLGILYSDLSIGNLMTIGLDGVGLANYLLAVFIPMRAIIFGRWGASTGSEAT